MTRPDWTNWALLASLIISALLACHERPNTRFAHELHLAGIECGRPGQPQCLTCSSCHREYTLQSSVGNAFELEREKHRASSNAATAAIVELPGQPPRRPDVERCESCHGAQSEALLARSQRRPIEARPLAYDIRFDHQRHLKLDGIVGQCVPCHSGAVRDSSELFPPMARCFDCHEHEQQFANAQCEPCHAAKDVQQLVPRTFLTHDQRFARHHETEALQSPELCGTCHTQQQCDDCHDMNQRSLVELRRPEAVERPRTHSADFLTRHALEARSQPATCLSCHDAPSCDSCHLERGVSAGARGAINPHPPGWATGNPASFDFHGRAARRDLLSCVGCHDQGPATNCIDCHRVGGRGGNPHPRGTWTNRERDGRMCRYCHVQ